MPYFKRILKAFLYSLEYKFKKKNHISQKYRYHYHSVRFKADFQGHTLISRVLTFCNAEIITSKFLEHLISHKLAIRLFHWSLEKRRQFQKFIFDEK